MPLQVVHTMEARPEQLMHSWVWVSPLPKVMVVCPAPSQNRHMVSPVPSHTKQGCVFGLSSDASDWTW